MIFHELFGKTADGRDVTAYTIQDGESYVRILDLGGTLQSIVVPDKVGKMTDVLLGYNDVAGYQNNGGFLGALIGRVGNRIEKGKMTIEGTEYKLYCNDRGNHLHGGLEGFDKKIWTAEPFGEYTLRLKLRSPDGEENYPGNLDVTVLYTFRNGRLTIDYTAQCDKTTAISLTNHAYFNMNGEANGTILDNLLTIDSDVITPTNETMIPQGEFRTVEDTAFDFRSPHTIGERIEEDDIDLKQGNGYDHNYVCNNQGKFEKICVAQSTITGIIMNVYTDMPAVQFYAGNGLNQQGKSAFYKKRSGFCLETQYIPNAVNVPEYQKCGSGLLRPGETYHFVTAYEFTRKV